jgi:uncharacterized protein
VDTQKLEVAASLGDVDAMFKLAQYYSSDDASLIDYPKAIYYFKQGISANHPPSFHGLARCYFYGLGVRKSYKRAYDYTYQAISLGHAKSRLFFSLFYLEGIYVKKDYFKAYDLVYDFAVNGDGYGQYLIGLILLKLKKYQDAISWFKRSAIGGTSIAARMLGQLYLEGSVVIQSQDLAATWFEFAANHGCQISNDILKAMKYFKNTLFKVFN